LTVVSPGDPDGTELVLEMQHALDPRQIEAGLRRQPLDTSSRGRDYPSKRFQAPAG
jgi:hypothetical protein